MKDTGGGLVEVVAGSHESVKWCGVEGKKDSDRGCAEAGICFVVFVSYKFW